MSKFQESYKWELNPPATLSELVKSEVEPSYKNTICGQHRLLWLLLNVDLNGYIPQELLDKVNDRLETAYKMGKRMDHRLRENYAKEHGVTEAVIASAKGQFVSKVDHDFRPPKQKR